MVGWRPVDETKSKTNGPERLLSTHYLKDGTEYTSYKTGDGKRKPILADYERNGKACASGLAYARSATEGRCAEFEKMEAPLGKEATKESNFRCDPTNQNNYCHLFFKIHDDDKSGSYASWLGQAGYNNVQNTCKCSLAGKKDTPSEEPTAKAESKDDGKTPAKEESKNHGYCSTMLGTELYTRAVASMAAMMGNSECHTRDRFRMRAQKDKACGIGYYSDEYRMTIDQNFNMTYWPYIHTQKTYKCVRRFFADSFDSLILDSAQVATLSLVSLAVGILVYLD